LPEKLLHACKLQSVAKTGYGTGRHDL
jgi:hypothetical protein